MISLQKCREILGNGVTLSDEALELLRDQLYAFADVTTTEFLIQKQAANVEALGEFDGVEISDQTVAAERVVTMEQWRSRKQGSSINGSNFSKTN